MRVLGLFDAETADVYNLSVEGEEEYFANGILVHNCRYLIMSVGGEPEWIIFDDLPGPDQPRAVPLPGGQFAIAPRGEPLYTLDDYDGRRGGTVEAPWRSM